MPIALNLFALKCKYGFFVCLQEGVTTEHQAPGLGSRTVIQE